MTVPLAPYLVLAVPLIMFVATFIRSTLGFGEALVSVPMLALLVPIQTATPLAVLVSVTVALVVVVQDWRHVHLRSAGWMVVSSLLGIPLGLWLLKAAPDPLVKALLATVILVFALYSLYQGSRWELKDDRLAWVFGFAAGVLGGAYGMNGPPLAVYGTLRRWSPVRFRATLQGYFLCASALVLLGYLNAGLWTRTVSRYYLWSLPGLAVAVLLGRAANRRLAGPRFYRLVWGGLLLIGVVLLLEACGGLCGSW